MRARQSVVICAMLLFVLLPRIARAETIRDFSSVVEVDGKGKIALTETIRYDFENISRHGIFRTIPYSYTNPSGTHVSVNLAVQSVRDERGLPYRYSLSRSDGKLEIKIGDPDTLITGEHTYTIRYTANRVFRWYDGEPELYWNVTGGDWAVPIEKSSLTLTGAVTPEPQRIRCFTGAIGSTETACSIEPYPGHPGFEIKPLAALNPREGFTFAARYPAGSLTEPSNNARALWFLQDNWGFGLPAPALLLLIILFRRYGRDPKGRGTIIAEYEPPKDVSPALLGYLIDERIDTRDIAATILQLAVKGYLRIEHVGRKLQKDTYRLFKKKATGTELTPFERMLFDALFGDAKDVQLSDLQKTLPAQLPSIKQLLKDEAKEKGFYTTSPNIPKAIFAVVGAAMIFLAFQFFGYNLPFAVGLGLTGLLTLGFAPFMSRRTSQGVGALEHIKGFKEFLTVTEKDRLKFHNAPSVRPQQFMAFLPFAVALGVEREWAKQFEHITISQPDWYTGNWTTFNAVVFASNMSDFRSAAASQALSAPGSHGGGFAGGGFSGGGFGGGGGGSW